MQKEKEGSGESQPCVEVAGMTFQAGRGIPIDHVFGIIRIKSFGYMYRGNSFVKHHNMLTGSVRPKLPISRK